MDDLFLFDLLKHVILSAIMLSQTINVDVIGFRKSFTVISDFEAIFWKMFWIYIIKTISPLDSTVNLITILSCRIFIAILWFQIAHALIISISKTVSFCIIFFFNSTIYVLLIFLALMYLTILLGLSLILLFEVFLF